MKNLLFTLILLFSLHSFSQDYAQPTNPVSDVIILKGIDFEGVENALQTSETLEVNLNATAVHQEVALYPDSRMGAELLRIKPPESISTVPRSVQEARRPESQALYKQEQRTTGSSSNLRVRRAAWFSHPLQRRRAMDVDGVGVAVAGVAARPPPRIENPIAP